MSLTRGVRNSRPRWTMGRPRCCRWELGRSYPPTDGIARHWASMVDTPRYGIHPCAPLAPRCKSELVAWSLEPFARHTQTVNLYAPLTLPVGQARGKHYPQVWSGGRLVGPRYTPSLPYACMLFAHSMSSQRLVSNLWACGRAQSPRAAHGLYAHTACAIGGWSRGPRRNSDEGCVKRLTQGCGSTLEKSKPRLRLFSPASTPLER